MEKKTQTQLKEEAYMELDAPFMIRFVRRFGDIPSALLKNIGKDLLVGSVSIFCLVFLNIFVWKISFGLLSIVVGVAIIFLVVKRFLIVYKGKYMVYTGAVAYTEKKGFRKQFTNIIIDINGKHYSVKVAENWKIGGSRYKKGYGVNVYVTDNSYVRNDEGVKIIENPFYVERTQLAIEDSEE